jgi:LPXTG-motif cell wall-anchored protein
MAAIRRRVVLGSLLAAATAAAVTAVGAPAAGAAPGWSRVPASGLGGGTVRVASSSTTLCQWVQPANTGAPPPDPAPDPAPADPTAADPATAPTTPGPPTPDAPTPELPSDGDRVYDGTEVQVRLAHAGLEIPVGHLSVTTGGAWSGTVTVPDIDVLGPGDYDLFVKCVIDRPELDGLRTYDFDPLDFTVIEGPPPVTAEPPPELIPPVTATKPVEVQGVQIVRPAAPVTTRAPAGAPAATLPNTGDGTLGIALAGLGALLVGGSALWWGARYARRHPELVD